MSSTVVVLNENASLGEENVNDFLLIGKRSSLSIQMFVIAISLGKISS